MFWIIGIIIVIILAWLGYKRYMAWEKTDGGNADY